MTIVTVVTVMTAVVTVVTDWLQRSNEQADLKLQPV